MYYNYTHDYNDIYSLNIGQSPSLNFKFYDEDNNTWVYNLTPTLVNSNLNINQEGYYYRTYNATDGLFYDITFRVVFKVGNPTSGPRTPIESVGYLYDDPIWKDLLTEYTVLDNGVTRTSIITSDEQGNPETITNFKYNDVVYNHADFEFEGRDLVGIKVYSDLLETNLVANIEYKYNDNGYRIQKTINSQVIDYTLSGDKVLYETDGTYGILFTYDVDGSLISFNYDNNINDTIDGVEYIYIRDILGNITKVVDIQGNIIVEYWYDAFGNITKIEDNSSNDEISSINPYTYRGYRYDSEISMYYLNSRYYNPEMGRFINADGLLGEQGNILSHNMFTYCANNSILYQDPSGESFILACIAIGAIAGGIIGGITAYNNNGDILAGIFTGMLLGAAVGAVIGLGGAAISAGIKSVIHKFIADYTAYSLYGKAFGEIEDYVVAFAFGGLTKGLKIGGYKKLLLNSFGRALVDQGTEMLLHNESFDFGKFSVDTLRRGMSYGLPEGSRSLFKGVISGAYDKFSKEGYLSYPKEYINISF